MPYAIEKIDTGEIVKRFGSLPKSFEVEIDGHLRRVIAPVAVGDEGLGHRFIEVVQVGFDQPGTYFTKGTLVVTREGNVRTETQEWTAWTQQEIDAFEAVALDAKAASFDVVGSDTRALALMVLEESNLHAERITAILDAIDGASSLAQVKTAIALIPDVPQRTSAQLRAAFKTKLVNGS